MKYALKKIVSLRHYAGGTMKHKFTLNDLKSAQLTGDSELVYAEGTDGAKLAAFDINKVAGFNCSNGAIDEGALAAQVGSEVVTVTSGNEILLRDEIELTAGMIGEAGAVTVTLRGTPAGDTPAASVKLVAKASESGTPDGKVYDTFTATGKTVAITDTELKAGDTIIVDYYPNITNYKKIVNDADKFTETGMFVIDAWFTDLCTNEDVPMQLVLRRGKMTGNIDMSFGDQVAVQNITVEAMYNACKGSKGLWEMYTYDEENIVSA